MARKKTHGMTDTPEYHSWGAMISRCRYKHNIGYKNYGGKGITVCDRWLESFQNFYADMGPRPKGTSLDRKNNDGNYEPGNCRWATRKEQQENKKVVWSDIRMALYKKMQYIAKYSTHSFSYISEGPHEGKYMVSIGNCTFTSKDISYLYTQAYNFIKSKEGVQVVHNGRRM